MHFSYGSQPLPSVRSYRRGSSEKVRLLHECTIRITTSQDHVNGRPTSMDGELSILTQVLPRIIIINRRTLPLRNDKYSQLKENLKNFRRRRAYLIVITSFCGLQQPGLKGGPEVSRTINLIEILRYAKSTAFSTEYIQRTRQLILSCDSPLTNRRYLFYLRGNKLTRLNTNLPGQAWVQIPECPFISQSNPLTTHRCLKSSDDKSHYQF